MPAPPQVSWASVDPRSNNVVPYDIQTSNLLEAAFSNSQNELEISVGKMKFWVQFRSMTQRNATGGTRTVIRQVLTPPPPVHIDPLPPPRSLEETFDSHDALVDSILKNISTRSPSWNDSSIDARPVLQVYESILQAVKDPAMVAKFNGCSADVQLCDLPPNVPVPNYFANAAGESIYRRKVLSILGLRNLVVNGLQIFKELHSTLFSGCPGDYGPNMGLNRMRALTGNTVDLDTVVLNVNVQFRELNKLLQSNCSTTEQFSRSAVVLEYVFSQAEVLIENFVDVLKLCSRERESRRLVLPPKGCAFHIATGHTDRGTHAVWQYQNVGVNTFHVNVPHLDDVFGALLKAPFHAARAFCLLSNDGKPTSADRLSYFEDCVSDSCFNGKWKAIEGFLHRVETRHDIPKKLSDLQAQHQKLFLRLLEDDDAEKAAAEESALMKKLVSEAKLVGRDPKTKRMREVTPVDVDEWLKAVNAA